MDATKGGTGIAAAVPDVEVKGACMHAPPLTRIEQLSRLTLWVAALRRERDRLDERLRTLEQTLRDLYASA